MRKNVCPKGQDNFPMISSNWGNHNFGEIRYPADMPIVDWLFIRLTLLFHNIRQFHFRICRNFVTIGFNEADNLSSWLTETNKSIICIIYALLRNLLLLSKQKHLPFSIHLFSSCALSFACFWPICPRCFMSLLQSSFTKYNWFFLLWKRSPSQFVVFHWE